MYQRKCRANREERLNIKFMTGCFTACWFLPHNTSLPMAGELGLDLPEGPFQPNPFCDNIWVKLYNFHYWQFLVVPLVLELAVNTSQPPTRNKWEVMPLGTQKYLTSENTHFVTQNFYCWVLKVPPDSPSNSYRPPLEPCHVFKIHFLAHFIPVTPFWCDAVASKAILAFKSHLQAGSAPWNGNGKCKFLTAESTQKRRWQIPG